ncbi:MAG: hypothetical protein V1711_01080 [bacterium]
MKEKLQYCGILLRGYAKTKSEVEDVVGRLLRSVAKATEIGFSHIAVLVSKEKDCGETGITVIERIKFPSSVRTAVLSPKGNDSDVLNAGITFLKEYRCQHVFIVSNKAIEYLTAENVSKMLAAFDEWALVAGLAVRDPKIKFPGDDPDYIGILHGRISNVFSAWDMGALNMVGGFTSKIGVEETSVLIRLVRGVRKICIAPVLPEEQTGINVSALRTSHHEAIFSTKKERQLKEAEHEGGSFELIRSGILSGYPK